jgi:hypothetical protein
VCRLSTNRSRPASSLPVENDVVAATQFFQGLRGANVLEVGAALVSDGMRVCSAAETLPLPPAVLVTPCSRTSKAVGFFIGDHN